MSDWPRGEKTDLLCTRTISQTGSTEKPANAWDLALTVPPTEARVLKEFALPGGINERTRRAITGFITLLLPFGGGSKEASQEVGTT
jgi:hypothetical protein